MDPNCFRMRLRPVMISAISAPCNSQATTLRFVALCGEDRQTLALENGSPEGPF
jgi:hypothetical protein